MNIRKHLGTGFILAWVAVLLLASCSAPVAAQGGPTAGARRGARSGGGQGLGGAPRVDEPVRQGLESGALGRDLAGVPAGELSDVEAQGLLYMREEEKLARDVYLALYEQWGMQVFSNIAGSEETHMAAVKSLLDRYGLADPAEGKAEGEFASQELQALYDQLVTQGSQSLVDALQVGAVIEEIDILDLDEYAAQTGKADLLRVYDSLRRGSENHLRAFVSSLEQQGVQYERVHLSQEAYDEILSGETGRGGGQSGRGGQGGRGRQGS